MPKKNPDWRKSRQQPPPDSSPDSSSESDHDTNFIQAENPGDLTSMTSMASPAAGVSGAGVSGVGRGKLFNEK